MRIDKFREYEIKLKEKIQMEFFDKLEFQPVVYDEAEYLDNRTN